MSADRARYIDGLRVLASVLEAHPDIPLPHAGNGTAIRIDFWGDPDGQRAAMAAAARAMPCAWRKKVWGQQQEWLNLEGEIAGLKIALSAQRDAVCKRVVTGTREVTETVKDPAKLAEVPEVEITRTEDIVTWDCGSLLSPLAAAGPKSVTP